MASTSVKKYIILLVIVFAVILYLKRPQYLTEFNVVPAKANVNGQKLCVGKPTCVIVYLAPWCPHCQSAATAVRALIQQYNDSSELGFSAIVGSDKPEALEALAAKIGDYTFVDVDGSFKQKAKVRGIPAWLVLDASGKVLRRESGALSPGTPPEHYLELLGIKEKT